MSVVVIVGAGMMGSALCWPLADNGHTVRLVGTPLDEEIVRSIRQDGVHPKLQRPIPKGVAVYDHRQLPEALQGAEGIASGVSSFGVDWFSAQVGSRLQAGVLVIAVTKGLVDLPDGSLQTLPDYTRSRLPAGLREKASLNAIGGPCIAHELAARRQTAVVFCGPDPDALERLRQTFETPYYHIWTSPDLVGVEVCAALKNAYALAVGMVVGMQEKAGADGLALMYNPQAAVFAQSVFEMKQFLELFQANPESTSWLPGPGDLYVTVFGGRTVRMGKLLGAGYSYPEARAQMAGETLESIEIITRVGRALPKLERGGRVKAEQFPLMRHLYRVVCEGAKVELPWRDFFRVGTTDGHR